MNKTKHTKEAQYKELLKLSQDEKEVIFNETDYKITQREISKCIQKLRNKKSPGLDQVLPEMIKYSQHILLPILEKIFNYILTKGKYPSQWLKGYIVPIYKKGDKTDPSNYRGITITSCMGKLFNMIMNERLQNYFTKHNLISKYQIGFKKGSRTSDHIFVLNTLIEKYLRKGQQLYTCFVDLKKAFDSVNRMKLMVKLKQTGIGSLMYNIIKDMYTSSDAKLSVKLGNRMTNTFTSEIRLFQGDVLSPLLFNLYINGIADMSEGCDPALLNDCPISCLMYADDIVLTSTSEKGLQKSIQKLYDYCKTWDLTINTDKTKVVIFNKKGTLQNTNFCCANSKIKCEQTYKYLGILLSSNGKLTNAKMDLGKRGQKAVFKLRSMFKQANVDHSTLIHLFDHTIKPILLYGSEIWGHTLLNKGLINTNILERDEIEHCHLKYCRSSLAVSRKAPNIGIYGETGRYPLAIEAVTNALKYWQRLQNIDKSSLIHHSFLESRNINQDNSWHKTLTCLLSANNIVGNITQQSIRNIKAHLISQFSEEWKGKLFDDKNKIHGNKLRNYRTYKTQFKKEEYLHLKSKNLRGTFARLRLSAHNLHIETGRYLTGKDRKDPKDRICVYCDLNECEDEYHFVMRCPLYSEYRFNFMDKISREYCIFDHYCDEDKFIWLMANVDLKIIYEFTSYINKCFVKRKHTKL